MNPPFESTVRHNWRVECACLVFTGFALFAQAVEPKAGSVDPLVARSRALSAYCLSDLGLELDPAVAGLRKGSLSSSELNPKDRQRCETLFAFDEKHWLGHVYMDDYLGWMRAALRRLPPESVDAMMESGSIARDVHYIVNRWKPVALEQANTDFARRRNDQRLVEHEVSEARSVLTADDWRVVFRKTHPSLKWDFEKEGLVFQWRTVDLVETFEVREDGYLWPQRTQVKAFLDDGRPFAGIRVPEKEAEALQAEYGSSDSDAVTADIFGELYLDGVEKLHVTSVVMHYGSRYKAYDRDSFWSFESSEKEIRSNVSAEKVFFGDGFRYTGRVGSTGEPFVMLMSHGAKDARSLLWIEFSNETSEVKTRAKGEVRADTKGNITVAARFDLYNGRIKQQIRDAGLPGCALGGLYDEVTLIVHQGKLWLRYAGGDSPLERLSQ